MYLEFRYSFKAFDIMLTDNSVVSFDHYAALPAESKDGKLYCISYLYGLLKFDYEANLFVQIPLSESFNNSIRKHNYYKIIFDKENNLWLAHSDGLFKIDLCQIGILETGPGDDGATQVRLRKINT